jgi:DNA-binding winged helix-turn-helix (wHTH) protein
MIMRVGFDDFTFDSDTKELLRQEQSVPLSPKAFQLLEILIEN